MLHTGMLATTLLFLFVTAASSSSSNNGTAYVSQTVSSWEGTPTTTLLKAVTNQQITNIVLIGDYTLTQSNEFDGLQGSPVPISRNLTIGSLDGEWPTLDLGYAYEILHLCSECLLRFKGNLTLANDRRGTNPTYDFVTGQPGSRILCDHVYRQRLVCTSGQESADTIRSYQRSTQWPDAAGPQLVHVADVWYKGKLYPDSMVVDDASFDVARVRVEGRGYQGGYSQHCKNVVRICEHIVTEECLKKGGPEFCVTHMLDELLAAQDEAAGRSPAVLAAAIAVPVVVVAVLVVAVVWVYIHRRRRRSQQQLEQSKFDAECGTGTLVSGACTPRHSRDPTQFVKGSSGGSGGPVDAVPSASTAKDWELVSSFNNDSAGFDMTEDHVDLGNFIGAGSFGRVYRAVYSGRIVAVKVIEHHDSATQAVQHEMHLMMHFNCRHLVAAYKCLTFLRVGAADSSCSAEFPIYVAAMSTHNSAAAGSYNPAAIPSSDCQGLVDIHRSGLSTPPAAMTSGSGLQHSSSRASGEGRQTSLLATWLVQEYCDRGTLKEYVIQSGLPPRLAAGDADAMKQLLDLLHGAAIGLQALHDAKVVHGDLNCRNVLVASDCNTMFGVAAKVADLGVSRALLQHKTHRTTSNLGTITHSAPELLRFGRMSCASDVFSFGIMMWALYTGQEPYGKLLYGQFYETVVVNDLRPVLPADMPEPFATLMEHCWASTPAERPTTEQLLQTLMYLVENLPAQMAATNDPHPDALRRVHSSPLPTLLARAPRRQQKRDKQQQDLMAAAIGVVDMAERSDSLLPEPVTCAEAAATDTSADSKDPLNRIWSQPVSSRDLPRLPHGEGLPLEGKAFRLPQLLPDGTNCELQLTSDSQGYQLDKEQGQQAWIV